MTENTRFTLNSSVQVIADKKIPYLQPYPSPRRLQINSYITMKTMFTKIRLVVLLCLQIHISNAQQTGNNSDFEAYGNALNKTLSALVASKDYTGVILGLEEYESRYRQLPQASQTRYASNMPAIYYNLACYQALAGQKEKAIANFGRATAAGYRNYGHMIKDTDLDGLRTDPQFKRYAQQMRERGDYGHILKTAGPYLQAKTNELPSFHYQSASETALINLRKKYKLDSIAGQGTEHTRLKNVLLWAHNVVKHDGNSSNPVRKNADELIEICKKENRGVNCRMMATILRDAYQSLGYPTRVVTCLPKDSTDVDCHVINAVWSNESKKWLWMDPTFNAYVSDDKGQLLGIEEVRHKLIKGQPLVLNADANWNNQNKQTKAEYLDNYMSKNLYWLQVSTESEWNIETKSPGKKLSYINLYPSGFATNKPKITNGEYASYYAINDDTYFWQKPSLSNK